jgi:uncharacterized protein YbjQ (UPF0145 family)
MKFKREYRRISTRVGESLTFLQRKRDEHQEALDKLIKSTSSEANAVIGVKQSTAIHKFPGKAFLFITYIEAPVVIEEKKYDIE